jgi:hypothetical protein
MPVEIKIEFIDATDTTFIIMTNAVVSQTYNFQLNKEPLQLIFDPDREIVLKEASTVVVSMDEDEIIPEEFSLGQNYPNPFNPTTNIEFRIADFGFVSLKIYDVLGNEVAVLVNEEKPAGIYSVEFDASVLSSGTYFYKLTAGKFSDTKKLIILK